MQEGTDSEHENLQETIGVFDLLQLKLERRGTSLSYTTQSENASYETQTKACRYIGGRESSRSSCKSVPCLEQTLGLVNLQVFDEDGDLPPIVYD
jgi:hypothetical protein